MLEIFPDAVYRHDVIPENFSAHGMGPVGDPALVLFRGIDLADPARVAVAGRADENMGKKIPETKALQIHHWIMVLPPWISTYCGRSIWGKDGSYWFFGPRRIYLVGPFAFTSLYRKQSTM